VEVLRGDESCMQIFQARSQSPGISCVLRLYICSPLGVAGVDPSGELYNVFVYFWWSFFESFFGHFLVNC